MALKALLVDLDGTLVSSAAANAAAYAEALAECGVTVDPVAIAPQIDGRHWMHFLPELIGARDGVSAAAVAARKRSLYPGFFHLLQLNHRLVDLVRLVHGPVATALVTTASSIAVDGVMRHFDLRSLFDVVICGDEVARAKPAPDGYVAAAALLQATPDECLVIEDSETGMEAARAFGGSVLRWSGPMGSSRTAFVPEAIREAVG